VAADIDRSVFVVPDWDAPLNVDASLRAVPDGATVKGMFLQRLLDDAAAKGVAPAGRGPYRAFKDYPLRELLEIEVELAPRLFPAVALREGLRRLGWTAYPTLVSSLIGRIIFGVLGDDLPAIFRTAMKGYKVSISVGSASVIEVGSNHAVIRLQEMYNFADSYQVGVFEGVFRHYDRSGKVKCHRTGEFDLDILAMW
jgi:uncharacterized protein (TIGR02265 family)